MKCSAIILLLLCSISIAGCGGGGGSGSSNSSNPLDTNACSVIGVSAKIINGTQCNGESNSPVVKIYIDSATEGALCTGTLITPTKVLTAAHCFRSFNVQSTSVFAGGRQISASSWTVHPNYRVTANEIFNDIAVITLSQATAAPTLPLLVSRSVESGDTLSIFGYGQDNNGFNETFRSGRMLVQDVTSTYVSAFFEGEGSDPCFGDSGGPALFSFTRDGRTVVGIAGVLSSGTSENCSANDLNFYTNPQNSEIFNFIAAHANGVGTI